MPDDQRDIHDTVGAWAKRFYLTSRTLVESTLREYDLGPTQWYVLSRLANEGQTLQRDLGQLLKVERATLSAVVATLVRKGFVEQVPDVVDQRQRVLSITEAGRALWAELPDPGARAGEIAFSGMDEADLAIAREVLVAATEKLAEYIAAQGDASLPG